MKSAMSEKRSITESQKPPNLLTHPSSTATLPSMKSKMLATIMMIPARTKCPFARSTAAHELMRTPTNVRMLGWIRNATHVLTIARSGNMQIVPMRPVKLMELLYFNVRSHEKTTSVDHAHPGPQGADRPPARTTGRLPLFQRG